MTVQSWGDVLVLSLQNVWTSVVSFLPTLIIAIIVLLIGLFVASVLGSVVEKIFEALKLDTFI
jgi:hypothetical protein